MFGISYKCSENKYWKYSNKKFLFVIKVKTIINNIIFFLLWFYKYLI